MSDGIRRSEEVEAAADGRLPPDAGYPHEARGGSTASAFRLGKIASHTLIYGAGIILSKSATFLMLPIYTNYLTPADYGVLQLIQMTVDAGGVIAGASFVAGIFRFYFKTEALEARSAYLSTALAILAVTYTLVSGITFLAADKIALLIFGTTQHTGLLRLAAGSLLGQGLLLVPLAYIRIRERSKLFVAVHLAKLLLGLTLIIIFVVPMRLGVRGVLMGAVISNGVFAIGLVAYMLREVPAVYTSRAGRELLRFGLPLLATHVALFVSTFGDRYFLQAAGGPAVVGLYSLSYQFGLLIFPLVFEPFNMVWEPVRFQVAGREDRDQLYARSFIYFNVLLLSAATAVVVFVSPVIRVMAAPDFHSAASIVPIIVAAYVLQSWTEFQNIGIMIRERTEFITVANWAAVIIALVGYALLVPRFLGLGAAVATLAAFGVRYLLVYSFSQRLWPVRYSWRPVILLALLAMLVYLARAFTPEPTLGVSIAVGLVLFAVYVGAVWALPIFSETERATLRRLSRSPVATVARLLG